MSLRFEVPTIADARLIVTALHIAGGAIQDEPPADQRQRFLRVAFEISAGLLTLEQRMELHRRISGRTKLDQADRRSRDGTFVGPRITGFPTSPEAPSPPQMSNPDASS